MSLEESLRSEAYPYSERLEELKDYLSGEVDLNSDFPAVQVIGSYVKGYATNDSDVEFKLYMNDVPAKRAEEKYFQIEEVLEEGGYKPCRGSPLFNEKKFDRQIVDLDSINADKIDPDFVLPASLYSLLCKGGMIFSENLFGEYMDLADLFAEGFVEHPSMEESRKEIIEDLKNNENAEEVWDIADKLYRSHLSYISPRIDELSFLQRTSVEKTRRQRFGLPKLDYL